MGNVGVPTSVYEHKDLLWFLVVTLSGMGVISIVGFFKVLWSRGDKYVLKESCVTCKEDWTHQLKGMDDKLDMIMTFMYRLDPQGHKEEEN